MNGQFYFTAKARGSRVDLEWTTNTDFKNDFFVIEHSVNGIDFTPLNEQESISESLHYVRYQDKDMQPSPGKNYYRIKRQFLDGSFVYSAVREVTLADELEEQLSIYPNPAEKEIFVHTRDFVGQKTSLQIQNLLGQTMTERSFDAMPDEPIAFQLNGFEAGVYALKIQVEGRKVVTKLFVVADL